MKYDICFPMLRARYIKYVLLINIYYRINFIIMTKVYTDFQNIGESFKFSQSDQTLTLLFKNAALLKSHLTGVTLLKAEPKFGHFFENLELIFTLRTLFLLVIFHVFKKRSQSLVTFMIIWN